MNGRVARHVQHADVFDEPDDKRHVRFEVRRIDRHGDAAADKAIVDPLKLRASGGRAS